MIGDYPLINNRHKKIANILIPRILQKYKGHKLTISIGGFSGTGKTEIASLIQKYLWKNEHIRVKTIHLDDFYKTNWHERTQVRKKKGLDYIGRGEINWKKVNRIFRIFKTSLRKNYTQRIHMFTDSIEYVIFNNNSVDILILEGLYACYANLDYNIYLKGNVTETEEFRKKRGKEKLDDFRKQVLEKEGYVVRASIPLANVIIPFNVDNSV